MAKFRPGEFVWVLSDGSFQPEGRFKGTIVRQKNSGHYVNDAGQFVEVEVYAVKIPDMDGPPNQVWIVTSNCLRQRVQDVVDPPGLTDHDPNGVTSWDRCEWQPGDRYQGGKVYVP